MKARIHRSRTSAFAILAAAVVAFPLAVHSGSAAADPTTEKVDIGHTSVTWSVWHGGFTKVSGIFRKIDKVDLVFDPDDVANSKIEAVIDVASLDSNHFFRDNFTRSDTFLNVKKFPLATFKSTKISKTTDNKGKMIGDLTLHGVTKPVEFDVTYNKGGKHISGKYMIDGFTATTTLKRSDFGMSAFIPWVGDEVELVIQVEGNH